MAARGQCRGCAVDSPWMQDESEQALGGSWFALPLGWTCENQRPVSKAPAMGQGRVAYSHCQGHCCRVSAPDLEENLRRGEWNEEKIHLSSVDSERGI